MPQVDTNSTSKQTQEDAAKGLIFISKVFEYSKTDQGKSFTAAAKTMADTKRMGDIGLLSNATKLNPKSAAIAITSVGVHKAMHFAGISTNDQAVSCVIAATKLGSSLAVAAAMGTSLAGIPAGLAVLAVALESHDVGKQCFLKDGKVAFALK